MLFGYEQREIAHVSAKTYPSLFTSKRSPRAHFSAVPRSIDIRVLLMKRRKTPSARDMARRRLAVLAMLCAAGLLAACHHSPQLSVEPSAIPYCGPETKPISVTVTWDVGGATDGPVRIWVRDRRSDSLEPVLWTEQGGVGSASTGPWILPGTVISMTDVSGKKVFAKLRVGGSSCPHPA
jgi:hypothetical protein